MNPRAESDAGQPAGILVVDDTPANLQVLAGMLKDRGYKVRPVPGGKLALLAARRDPPDLILLDINMPEMNGYEVCEHLKADDELKGIPVIFISALTEQLDKVKAFAIGGVDYITKPFQMEELHARVETHLKLRRLQIELEETNARLAKANGRMSRDLKAAAKIQETFLPREAPRVPGTDFAWIYRPCDELAGDGLNVIPLGDGKVGLYILDVSGHGVASALLSVTLSRLLSPPSEPSSILIRDGDVRDRFDITPPAEVAARLNRLFPFDTATEQFATMVYGILNAATGEFRYVSAGHPGPVHLPSGADPVILESQGFPDRPGRRRLRGAVGPPGGGRPPVPLLRWRPRGDGPRRQAVRRRPAPGGDRPRAVRTAPGGYRCPPGGDRSVVWRRPAVKTTSPSWPSSSRRRAGTGTDPDGGKEGRRGRLDTDRRGHAARRHGRGGHRADGRHVRLKWEGRLWRFADGAPYLFYTPAYGDRRPTWSLTCRSRAGPSETGNTGARPGGPDEHVDLGLR